MHKTGRYRTLNIVFGILPFFATVLMSRLTAESGPAAQWLSIASVSQGMFCTTSDPHTQIPLGFGNAVVLQTTLSEYLHSFDP